MLGKQDNERLAAAGGIPRKSYLRSVSWSDRSPSRPIPSPRPAPNSKARSCLPPLQPLSIARRPAEEWPAAGSDDLGVWPNPQTPRGPVKPLENPSLELPPVREFQFKKDKLAFFDKECSRIANHVYLGSESVAKNRAILKENGITHVLNCVGFVCPEYFKNDLVYKTLWLQDSPSEDITSILYDVFDYFEDVREQGGRVLVHCCQGISRSTSLVIAYLMWREGQSFEDAFQYVKAARGVTNPNMGFACQLLQCQKRVHAVPASPNSALRVYRMAPHSSYDPLHLVPKMLGQGDVRGLDSRGAFIVHVPSSIFVWFGKSCSSVMVNQAKAAANQVIRYERAQGPVLTIREGEEPPEFWDALEISKEETLSVRERKIDAYDLDFELFKKALAGGVVPPFSTSNAQTETCLPAREGGWGKLRQKFATGKMKELLESSRLPEPKPEPEPEPELEAEPIHSLADSPSTSDNSPKFGYKSPTLSPSTSDYSPKFGYKSPTLSPSTSDYSSSSFAFSPSSTSNWSDLSYLSSRQPSPSGLEASDPSPASPTKVFSSSHSLRLGSFCSPSKGNSPSLAERRGSNPPPRMVLPSVEETAFVPRSLVRSWSFSLDDDVMKGHDELSEDEKMTDADVSSPEDGWRSSPANTHLQVVRQGEEPEPEQFVNVLSGFSFQDMENRPMPR